MADRPKALDLTQGAPWYQRHPTPLDYVGDESDTAWLEANFRSWFRAVCDSPALSWEGAFLAGYLAANRRWIQRREEKLRLSRRWWW